MNTTHFLGGAILVILSIVACRNTISIRVGFELDVDIIVDPVAAGIVSLVGGFV